MAVVLERRQRAIVLFRGHLLRKGDAAVTECAVRAVAGAAAPGAAALRRRLLRLRRQWHRQLKCLWEGQMRALLAGARRVATPLQPLRTHLCNRTRREV